ncbi:MAG: C39 family peptidase [Cyanobacteria bacterium REEB65]|nr:C39 family peptidase [Cyanobacteria bacterium REEB65]
MATQSQQSRRKLGEVLVDGLFIAPDHLEHALAEQDRTSERIGEVLVRLGFLSEMELQAVLAFNGNSEALSPAEHGSAVRFKLGDILLKSGKLQRHQLEGALAEQEATNERLGEVLVRLGLLGADELGALLEWQQEHSRNSAKAVRFMLGEILVATRAITRDQLKSALAEQHLTKRQIGDILVEAGLVKPNVLSEALRIQGKLVAASLVGLIGASFLSGCGTGVSLMGIQATSNSDSLQGVSNVPANLTVDNTHGTIVPYGTAAQRNVAGVSGAAPQTTALPNGHSVTLWGDGSRVIDNVPWIHQDATVNNDGVTPDNTCGQAATTMVMHYWQGADASSYSQVVNESNHFNMATSAGTLIGYLQQKGLQVNAYKHGTLNFLKSSVVAGHPVICMMDFSGVPHYVVVIGYNDSNDTILYHDSIDGPNMSMDSSQFYSDWTLNSVSSIPLFGGENYVGLAVDAHL